MYRNSIAVLFLFLLLLMAGSCNLSPQRLPKQLTESDNENKPETLPGFYMANKNSNPPSIDYGLDRNLPLALETHSVLASTVAPSRDVSAIIHRFNDLGRNEDRVSPMNVWHFDIGSTHSFWVENKDSQEKRHISATLSIDTPHAYFFVEDGLPVDHEQIKQLAKRFEKKIYPINRKYFGSEWSPNDHTFFLITTDLGNHISAYQNYLDTLSQNDYLFSNEKEIVYIAVDELASDDQDIDCLLAHELQHVIRTAVDPAEETWLNEAFSEAACTLNGVRPSYFDTIMNAFADEPDTQLNAWRNEPEYAAAQYGAVHLFVTYFIDRLGKEVLTELVANRETGINSLEQVLASSRHELDVDQLFADWFVASYLNDGTIEDGKYAYTSLVPPALRTEVEHSARELPVSRQAKVHQYGVDYIAIQGAGNYEFEFIGDSLVRLAPLSAHSGDYLWWSGRTTNGDATLTREFDLTGLEKATLKFFTWYDIEENFDNAYVSASLDKQHWQTLPGQTTSQETVEATRLVHGYTGSSSGWVQEELDLSPFVGGKVFIRFEYITDDGPTRSGYFLDDIEIPELNFYDDAEVDDGQWRSQGFSRVAPLLPQRWLMQLMHFTTEGTAVSRLDLDQNNHGSWTIELEHGEMAVLSISGLTQWTYTPAVYSYNISLAPKFRFQP